MNTHDLVAFVAVVETGSIVAASARLNLTQPGVTRRIQNLEEMLGAQLLDRLSKPLKPTAAGHEAYEQGRRLLRMLDDLKSGVANDGIVRGEFRLGLTPFLSEAGLTGPLDAVRAEFPGLAVRVVSGWSPNQLERVCRNELDVAAICLPDGAVPPADLVADDLGAQPVVFVVARDMKIPRTVDLERLSQLSWVINPDGCGFRDTLKRRFDAEHLPFSIAVEALDSESPAVAGVARSRRRAGHPDCAEAQRVSREAQAYCRARLQACRARMGGTSRPSRSAGAADQTLP